MRDLKESAQQGERKKFEICLFDEQLFEHKKFKLWQHQQ